MTKSDRTNSDRTRSAIYVGQVDHDRLRPRRHRFRYGMAYLYLDLDELPGVLDVHPLWSARRPAPAWFREADYFGRGAVPLAEAVRDAIEGHSGTRQGGSRACCRSGPRRETGGSPSGILGASSQARRRATRRSAGIGSTCQTSRSNRCCPRCRTTCGG